MGVIAQQDEDIESLLQLIAQLLARQDYDDPSAPTGDSEGDPPPVQQEDDSAPPAKENNDSEGKEPGSLNMDSADYIVRQRLEIARIGDKLRLDGLERLPLRKARERIIKAVHPELRLDGKDEAYVNAAYDIARTEAAKRKINSTDNQRKQMFNPAQARLDGTGASASSKARDRMISRMNGGIDK